MAKRPRYSRWRRLPPVFRSGDKNWPRPKDEERRVSLYIADSLLEQAEAQASRAGAPTIQDYCTDLLVRAIEIEHAREQVAKLEARRGALEGLHEIANDPEYLAEWSARVGPRDQADDAVAPRSENTVALPGKRPVSATPIEVAISGLSLPSAEALSPAAQVVLRHAGQLGDDPLTFLACLRRGEAVSMTGVSELGHALQQLEDEYRNTRTLDRRVAYALHRLAFEAQVLHTDAWPGSFDEWTVETLRAVQESVDRIISGQDIRYYPTPSGPENPL